MTDPSLRRYVLALDLAALLVWAKTTDGPCAIAAALTPEKGRKPPKHVFPPPGPQLRAVFWTPGGLDGAQRLTRRCYGCLADAKVDVTPAGWFDSDVEGAEVLIRAAAEGQGVPVRGDSYVRVKATCTAIIMMRVGELGGLREVNREYRTERLWNAERGIKTPSYGVWFADKQAKLIRTIAAQERHFRADEVLVNSAACK